MADNKSPKKKGKGVWNLFEKKGDQLVRKNVSCPKCGQGFFMARHKNRLYCGLCHYTEFTSVDKSVEKK